MFGCFFCVFFCFDLFLDFFYVIDFFVVFIVKYMWMLMDYFFCDVFDYIIEIEMFVFFGYVGVIDYL